MFREQFAILQEPELLDEISNSGRFLRFRRGETIVQDERYIRTIPLILKGTVKVLRVDENGNELLPQRRTILWDVTLVLSQQ